MRRKKLVKLVTTLTVIGVISAAFPAFPAYAENPETPSVSFAADAAGSLTGTDGNTADNSNSAVNGKSESGEADPSPERSGTSESGNISEENSCEKADEYTVTDASNESFGAEIVGTDSVSGSSETVSTSEKSPEEEKADVQEMPVVSYAAHVQRTGWPDKDVVSGENTQTYAGFTGKGLRVEAIRACIKGDQNLGITYRTYVQQKGWTGWQSDGAAAGTTGQGLRVEGIAMKLTGTDAEKYDLCYRVHVQSFGWLAWAKNGETAGTTNLSRRVEAFEVALVKKGEAAPVRSASRNVPYLTVPKVTYQTHVQKYGWNLGEASNGALGGTTGQGLRMEAIKIRLTNTTGFTGGISYCSHIQGIGWEKNWKADGATSGTAGKKLRLEAVRIRLTGEMANCFDVYYRTHIQKFGWSGWASNGEDCGSAGYGYRLEAIEIRIVARGSSAPGSTANTFWKYVNPHAGMDAIAQGYSSSTGYLLMVDRSAHRTGVYTGSRNNWQNQKYWLCSNGKASTPTITGVYRLGIKGLYFWSGNTKCWYYSQISGDYLFHSVIYDGSSSPVRILDGTLGAATSHGCVRLALENAKYIYDNVPTGTTVVIYN